MAAMDIKAPQVHRSLFAGGIVDVARLIFLLMFILGGVAGIGYPLMAAHVSGYEIGAWEAYSPADGFRPVAVNIAPSDAPLFPHVAITTNGPLPAGDRPAYLTLTVTADGKQERAETIDLDGINASIASPQASDAVYRLDLPVFPSVRSARYEFQFGEGAAGLDRLRAIRLTLDAGAFDVDPRAVPVGYILMAIGAIGLLLGFRQKPPQNPNSQPPAPRWGRNADG